MDNGCSSGIGAAVARKLAAEQALLILTARNTAALADVRNACGDNSCKILAADLTNFDAEALVTEAINQFGHIDVVIHCAGVSQRSLAIDTSLDVYRRLMEINFFAPVSITRYLLPHFATRPVSHIAAISSIAGLMGIPQRTGYSAAKHALMGYFESLQVEHTIAGLSITIVSPGRINTPISLAALNEKGEPHGVMDNGQLNGILVDQCADKIITGIKRGKKHVIIARGERLLWWLWWYLPSVYYKLARTEGAKN